MKIKPCPFCGGEVKTCDVPVDANTTGHHFICSNCDMTAYFDYLDEEESNEAWNRREPMDKIVEQLEEMINYKRERSRMYDGHTHYDSEIMGINQAIEIVKKGGLT